MDDLAGIDLDHLDALPFGAIVLDADGVVLAYNTYESRLSQLDALDVVGRDFFRDIAPCTAVREFQGRLHELAASESKQVTFRFTFRFDHGALDVAVTIAKLPLRDEFLVAVERASDDG